MGRKDKYYSRDLHQQVYERLTGMQAFGESKRDAALKNETNDKIYSFSTFKTYFKHCKYFVKWLKETHPDVTTLKSAKKYAPEWIKYRCNQTDKNGNRRLSAWTIHTDAAAVRKLFQLDKGTVTDLPKRERISTKRSRLSTEKDKHFSVTNNSDLIAFCQGTGCRRAVLERLTGDHLWDRERMCSEISRLDNESKYQSLSGKEETLKNALLEALKTFPQDDYFIFHTRDKGGKSRFAPIIGPNKNCIVERMKRTGKREKVWSYVNRNADVHSYRADYANALYKSLAREIGEIPYDGINHGSGKMYQKDVYRCRKDSEQKFDKRAMGICSRALGHSRLSVVAYSYLRGV